MTYYLKYDTLKKLHIIKPKHWKPQNTATDNAPSKYTMPSSKKHSYNIRQKKWLRIGK